MEHHGDTVESLPGVKFIICKGKEDLTIKVKLPISFVVVGSSNSLKFPHDWSFISVLILADK